ncbi:MAG: Hsp20/alpha crystallin family protein [Candidatus Taylorbacteria bacterium]|nr:Hsp20/alpha crystallin family protein [Candidatus Taylorbacteria bacterium]
MPKEKRSFFERLTGTVKMDAAELEDAPKMSVKKKQAWVESEEEEEKEGQLTVDVYHNPDDIVIKTMVAGVRPEDLDIAITRDMVTIRGKREEERGIKEEDFFTKELYWGTFSRTITLPQEIDVEESEAIERHGLLIIRLPKIDKGRQTKLKVKSNS